MDRDELALLGLYGIEATVEARKDGVYVWTFKARENPGMYIVQIMAPAVPFATSPWDGQYLVEYDPSRDSVSPTGHPMRCYLETTTNPAKAKRFASHAEFLNYYRQVDPREPFRPDGRPNCPLMYFTVQVQEAKAAIADLN